MDVPELQSGNNKSINQSHKKTPTNSWLHHNLLFLPFPPGPLFSLVALGLLSVVSHLEALVGRGQLPKEPLCSCLAQEWPKWNTWNAEIGIKPLKKLN